ncbi:contractile injection system protein, VgrG/Pvc8 family [Sphingomonas oryzagri]
MTGVANRAKVSLSVDGVDLAAKIDPRLLSFSLTEKRAGEADEFTLQIHNFDGKLAFPPKGAIVKVSLGWSAGANVTIGMIDKGSFKVDEREFSGPPDVFQLRGRSADFTADFRVRKDEAHLDTTLGDVVRKVAARNGLTPSVDPALASIAIPALGQTAKSDMALVRDLGRRYDARATVKAGKLIFAPIGAATTASGKTIAAATLVLRENDTYRLSEASRDAYDGVAAAWHDQDGAKRETVTAGASKGTHKRLHRTYATKADAQAATGAEWQRIQRGESTLDLALALGRPDLFPDRRLSLSGFPAPIPVDGWLISEATHTLGGDDGLRTALKLETT